MAPLGVDEDVDAVVRCGARRQVGAEDVAEVPAPVAALLCANLALPRLTVR